MLSRLAGLLLFVGTSAAQAEPGQSYDTYKSWVLACDNTLTCVAKGFAEDAAEPSQLRIERAGGPDGALSATIEAEAKVAIGDVGIDGAPANLEASAWSADGGDGGSATLSTDDPDAVRALIAAAHNGKVLTLGTGVDVPLEGLAAALLRMDERQGRIGTVTALLRPGQAPASHVPPAPPVPLVPNHPVEAALPASETARLVAAVRSGQHAVIDAVCQLDNVSDEPTAYALDTSRALVLVPCLTGAYQGSSLAFLASRDGGSSTRLTVPAPYRGDDPYHGVVDLFTEGDFDPSTGTLFTSAKGRGLTDCGMAASWIWNGTTFDLASLSLQQACGGEPGDWPNLFRSRQ